MKSALELKRELNAADQELSRRYRFAVWCENRLFASASLEEYKANEKRLQQAEEDVQAQAQAVQNLRHEWAKQGSAELFN